MSVELLIQGATHKSEEELGTEIKKRINEGEAIDVIALCIDDFLYEIRIRFLGLIDLEELLNIHRVVAKFAEENGYKVWNSRIESPTLVELVYSLKGESQ